MVVWLPCDFGLGGCCGLNLLVAFGWLLGFDFGCARFAGLDDCWWFGVLGFVCLLDILEFRLGVVLDDFVDVLISCGFVWRSCCLF